MSMRLTSDPSEGTRKIEKILLMLRFVWRFPWVKGGWPKYEYLKPWIVDLAPETVLDIGVNHGQFLQLARRLWPAVKIVGVESNAGLAAKAAAIYADDNTVTVESCAVGAGDGKIEFFVTANDQNSSIHQPSDAFHDDRADDGVVRTEKVPLRRLDGHRRPMLLQIDVQGAELEVLEGSRDRLNDVSVIVIESPFEQAYEGAACFFGSHILEIRDDVCFDYCGYENWERIQGHTSKKADQYWPGWSADLVELPSEVHISEQKLRTYDGLWLREPGQYLHNALPRARTCLDRYPLTELHPTHAAA